MRRPICPIRPPRSPGTSRRRRRTSSPAAAGFSRRGRESQTPYFLTYKVKAPAKATYNFWVRKFWKHGPFKWRFDSAEWATCGKDVALNDDTYLRQFIGANWVYLGQVPLEAGEHTLRIEMLDKAGGGALDCFVLIDGPFTPPASSSRARSPARPCRLLRLEPDADPLSDACPSTCATEREAGRPERVRHPQGQRLRAGRGRACALLDGAGRLPVDMSPTWWTTGRAGWLSTASTWCAWA